MILKILFYIRPSCFIFCLFFMKRQTTTKWKTKTNCHTGFHEIRAPRVTSIACTTIFITESAWWSHTKYLNNVVKKILYKTIFKILLRYSFVKHWDTFENEWFNSDITYWALLFTRRSLTKCSHKYKHALHFKSFALPK